MPVAAVRAPGMDTCNSGSTRASLGKSVDPAVPFLAFCPADSKLNTAALVTSEPVPAVVGMATRGGRGLVKARPVPMKSSIGLLPRPKLLCPWHNPWGFPRRRPGSSRSLPV
jgi:hypothetical protein